MQITRPYIRFIRYGALWLLALTCTNVHAQNLVPNPSFEDIAHCPGNQGGICYPQSLALPWTCGTGGTSDLFNSCNPSTLGVPENGFGTQPARSGDGYAGMIAKLGPTGDSREYCLVPLYEPLIANNWYSVSFFISLSDNNCGIDHFGAHLSITNPFQPIYTVLPLLPQIEANSGYLNDYDEWTLIGGCFQAVGGESYLVIGNFATDAETSFDPACGLPSAYYYLDDVAVVPTTPGEMDIELGDPIIACYSYEIDPNHQGPIFEWSDGSNGPTLTVTESGVYAVTVSDGCNTDMDSVEVTIIGNFFPVDLGPEEVFICEGDTYTIELDPDLSEYEWNDGSNDPTFEITTPGTYAVTLDDGCMPTSDEIVVSVLEAPAPFDLGEDLFLCLGDQLFIELDSTLGDFVWQDGDTSSSYIIEEGGTYLLTISNVCGAESDEIIVTDLDIPDIDLGPQEQSLCIGNFIEFEFDDEIFDVEWNDGSTSSIYEIHSSGIYSVTITNQCGSGSDEITVTTINPPVVNLGPDSILCGQDSIFLTTIPVDGMYTWQDSSIADTLLVTSPGLYTLSISNSCGDATDTVLISYQALVTSPGFGPDITLCPGEEIILHANNPGAEIIWQDLSTADTFLVTSSGTYIVQVSNYCNQETDTIVVTINDSPPQVDLPDQLSLCQGQNVTLDAVIDGVTYLWNDNSQNQQLVVATPGTYSLTVSNACGVDTDTVVILDGGPAPFVALGNDIDLCPGEMLTLTPVNSNVTSWLWHDGSTSSDFVVTDAGMVTVQVANTCSSWADTMIVNLLPATPPLDLGVDTSLCAGESFSLSINTPGVSILWPDGTTNTSYNVNGPGQVYAAISNSCGQAFDTIQVNALPEIPALNLGPDQSLCPGELITLNPGIINVNYLWQDGSTNNTYQTTQESTVILSISNECGVSTDTVEVIESTQGPQVDLGPDVQVCEGETVTIFSGISGVNYVWQDGSTDPDFTTAQSGTFSLQVNNNCGTDSDTLLVDISGVPPTPALGADTTLCEGIILNLVSTADPETTIEWQNGSSSPSFNVTASGTYILSESNRCGEAADTLVVAYLDKPDPFSLGPDTTLCPGESIILTAPTSTFEIEWQDGSNQLTMLANVTNTYSLQLSNDCGIVSDAIHVDFDDQVPQLNLDSSIPWCAGDIITLDATQPFIAEYLWSTGSIAPSIQVSSIGQYSVDVSTPCNLASQNIDVVPNTDCVVPEFHTDIYVPNVFSPNGDGINEEFRLSFGSDLQVLSMDGTIYDRWGNLVYHSEAISFSWDGNFAEKPMMPGVYVYTIKVKYTDGNVEREELLAGDVTILR